LAKAAKQPAYARCRTDNLSKETTRLLIHRRGLARCRDATQDTHGKFCLLVRELLLVNKVLVLQIEHLLVKGLLLTTSAKEGLVNAHLLTIPLLTQITQHASRSHLLLQTLQAKTRTKLTGLFSKVRTGQTVLGTLRGILLTELIGLCQLRQSLLLGLKLRLLVHLLRLETLTRTKLRLVDEGLEILLPGVEPHLLVGKGGLQRLTRPQLLRLKKRGKVLLASRKPCLLIGESGLKPHLIGLHSSSLIKPCSLHRLLGAKTLRLESCRQILLFGGHPCLLISKRRLKPILLIGKPCLLLG
jgi:hypothetical protein